MQLKDVMTHAVEVVPPEATLQEAARRMKEGKVEAVVVCDGDQLVGIVTQHDIALRATAEGWDPATTKIRDVMTPQIISCCEHYDVGEAVELMREKRIRHLAVLDHGKQLIGLVSLDALALRSNGEKLAGSAIRWPV